MTDLRKAAKDLLEGVEAAIKAGDWKVDGACDPDLAIVRLRQALDYPTTEQIALAQQIRPKGKSRMGQALAQSDDEALLKQGWRQCAVGQRTTQYCGMAEQARLEEREACAKLCHELLKQYFGGA